MSASEKLQAAFAAVLGLRPDADFESLEYGRTNGWDSVAHMALVNEIESAFDIMLATDDVIDLSSYRKAEEILSKYGVAAA